MCKWSLLHYPHHHGNIVLSIADTQSLVSCKRETPHKERVGNFLRRSSCLLEELILYVDTERKVRRVIVAKMEIIEKPVGREDENVTLLQLDDVRIRNVGMVSAVQIVTERVRTIAVRSRHELIDGTSDDLPVAHETKPRVAQIGDFQIASANASDARRRHSLVSLGRLMSKEETLMRIPVVGRHVEAKFVCKRTGVVARPNAVKHGHRRCGAVVRIFRHARGIFSNFSTPRLEFKLGGRVAVVEPRGIALDGISDTVERDGLPEMVDPLVPRVLGQGSGLAVAHLLGVCGCARPARAGVDTPHTPRTMSATTLKEAIAMSDMTIQATIAEMEKHEPFRETRYAVSKQSRARILDTMAFVDETLTRRAELIRNDQGVAIASVMTPFLDMAPREKDDGNAEQRKMADHFRFVSFELKSAVHLAQTSGGMGVVIVCKERYDQAVHIAIMMGLDVTPHHQLQGWRKELASRLNGVGADIVFFRLPM